jgi:DNA-binding NarL/FixJ family response regulator
MNLLIITSNNLVANLWREVLRDDPAFTSVEVVIDAREAVPWVREADVILIDIRDQASKWVVWIRDLKRDCPACKVVVAGLPKEEHIFLSYIEAGAAGFLPQDAGLEVVRRSILAVQQNEVLVDPEIAPALAQRLQILKRFRPEPRILGERLNSLTPREIEVLELVARQLTNREISRELMIEVGTVKNHVHNILTKMECASRYEAAEFYKSSSRLVQES